MKFDFCIGNPPYNDDFENSGDNGNFAKPVYHQFMDAATNVAEKVELVHPARFLFNAGSTPKEWNEKMLNDPHFKILDYHANAATVFPNTSINGGIVVSYHDNTKEFASIKVFTKYAELNSILTKITTSSTFQSMESIVFTRTSYRMTEKMHMDHPDAINKLSKGHAYDFASNIFDRLPEIFFNNAPQDGNTYIKALGRKNNTRVYQYIRRDYLNTTVNTDKYKVVLAKADGAAGQIGSPIPARITGEAIILEPNVATTESFITIGAFNTQDEAEYAKKYVRTQFARTMLGVLKVTQELGPQKWKYVPLQDFTSSSDIDWSVPVKAIDQQLYKKYNLSDEEIRFIETHVKEMA